MKVKVLFGTIKLGQASFGKAPKGFVAVDVNSFLSDKLVLFVINPKVFVKAYINQAIVTTPRIRVDGTVKVNLARHDLAELGSVGDHGGINLAVEMRTVKEKLG